MKKIIIILLLAVALTGCSTKTTCTQAGSEEGYSYQRKLVISTDKDNKVTEVQINYAMTFDSVDDAKDKYELFASINDDYDLTLEGRKIIVKSSEDYSEYEQSVSELKDELEKSGYACK